MQDLLDTVNRYGLLGSPPGGSSRPSPQNAAQQFLGSLFTRQLINSFCLQTVSEFMFSRDTLTVISSGAVQGINCDGHSMWLKRPIPNPLPGELTTITSAHGGAVICGTSGIAITKGDRSTTNIVASSSFAQNILCVAATPDNSYLATGGGNATVTVWSKDMEALHHLSGHTDWVRFVRFAKGLSGDLQLFSTGDDGVICLWDPIAGSSLCRLDYSKGQAIQVFEVSFATGLIAIACSSPVLALYHCLSDRSTKELGDDVLRLQQIGLLTGLHRSTPTAAKFTDDAHWIVSAGEDETLAVASVGEPRKTFMCMEFVTKRHCLTFMNTFTAICVLSAPPQSSAIIVAACASDGTVVEWVVDPRSNRSSYTKKIQLHMGALLSMDLAPCLSSS